MNSLPAELGEKAQEDLRALAPELRPAVLELLARLAANYATCSRETSYPRRAGREAGLWCRYPDGRGTLVELLFIIEVAPDRVFVRRVMATARDRLPDWAVRPQEWGNVAPWPIVDI